MAISSGVTTSSSAETDGASFYRRTLRRWRVAVLKVQAAQRFTKVFHQTSYGYTTKTPCELNSPSHLLRRCYVENLFSQQSTISHEYHFLNERTQEFELPTSVLSGRIPRTTSLANNGKAFYKWDFNSSLERNRDDYVPSELRKNIERIKESEDVEEVDTYSECDEVIDPEELDLIGNSKTPRQTLDFYYCHETVQSGSDRISGESFEPLKIIGTGSSGQVYLVKQKSSGQVFAMKVMNKLHVVCTKRLQRVMLERDILMKMKDCRLITKLAYAFDTDHDAKPWDSHFYFVLEYCNRGNLHQLMIEAYQKRNLLLTTNELQECFESAAAGNGLDQMNCILKGKSKRKAERLVSLPYSYIQFILAEVALALSALHENNVIFRDLKPQNILLHHDGHIRLGDFGVAKIISKPGVSRTSTFVGTLEYMSPEIVAGDPQGPAVDWWAYGILAYELLYGETPFKSKLCASRNCQKDLFFSIMEPQKITYPRLSPKYFSLISLIKQQLNVNPQRRLNLSRLQKVEYFRNISFCTILKGDGLNGLRCTSLRTKAKALKARTSSAILAESSKRLFRTFLNSRKEIERRKLLGLSDLNDTACSMLSVGLSNFHSGHTKESKRKNLDKKWIMDSN